MDTCEENYDDIVYSARTVKPKIDWNGMIQDLFGLDTPQSVERNLDSTSSGVVSDFTIHSPTSPRAIIAPTANSNINDNDVIIINNNSSVFFSDQSYSEDLFRDSCSKRTTWNNSPLPKTSTPVCVPTPPHYILRQSPASPLFFRGSDTPTSVHPLKSPDIQKQGKERTEISGSQLPRTTLCESNDVFRECNLSSLSISTPNPTFPFDPTYFHNTTTNTGERTETLHSTPHHTDSQNVATHFTNNRREHKKKLPSAPHLTDSLNVATYRGKHTETQHSISHHTDSQNVATHFTNKTGEHTETLYTKLHHTDRHSLAKYHRKQWKPSRPYYTQTSPFDDLMDDVIIRIFSNLNTDGLCRCAGVCRRWYELVWDPSLWSSITINSSTIHVDRALRYLTRRLCYNTPKVCVILERVNLNGCLLLTDKGLHVVARRCPELRYMELKGCAKLTNLGVCEAMSCCVNLEHLDLTGCFQITSIQVQGPSVIDTTSTALHLHLIYLRYLDMTHCTGVQDQALRLIASHCMQLQFLFLRRCFRVTDRGVTHIANSCYCLRELSVSDCRGITDLSLRELSKLGDNLRYLSVARCRQVSDQGVKYIARYCPKLRYLNVRGCEGITDLSLELVSRHCPRLCSLDVGKCDVTDVGLQLLAERCPQLRKVSVKCCRAVTDRGLTALAYHCPQLTDLHVQHCWVSPHALRSISKHCQRCWVQHTNPAFVL